MRGKYALGKIETDYRVCVVLKEKVMNASPQGISLHMTTGVLGEWGGGGREDQ